MSGPERQVHRTVGLGKTRNSTYHHERIDFTPAMNAISTAVENKASSQGRHPFLGVWMWLVNNQNQGYDYKKLLRGGESIYPSGRK